VKYSEIFFNIYTLFLLSDLQVGPPGRFTRMMAHMWPHPKVRKIWRKNWS